MVADPDKKMAFGRRLKVALAKYDISQVDIADVIGKTRQYVSAVINGKACFTPEQFNQVCKMLQPVATELDMDWLGRLFLEAKSNTDIEDLSNLGRQLDPMKQIIIDDLENMLPDQLIKIHKFIEQLKTNNMDQMARNAGVREFPGQYKTD